MAGELEALELIPASLPEGRTIPEQIRLRDFTAQEKQVLKEDGVVIYTLTEVTIPAQREARSRAGKPSFRYVVDAGERLLAVPSRKIEVAIFPDPKRFFVPNSFSKDTDTQERLAVGDAKLLRARLNLPGITQIIADEAATLAEIVFQHEEATGVWLFGPEYASAQGRIWVYGRTKNPTNDSGSFVAYVGDARSARGLSVHGWGRDDGNDEVGAPRLVVAIEDK